jgi:DNA polymerase III subunit delta'
LELRPLIGHERSIGFLQAAVQSTHAPQPLLLTGPRQVGKRTLALILARAANCTGQRPPGSQSGARPVDPCGVCRACRLTASGGYPDVHLVGLREGRQKISIRDIQELQSELARRPSEGKRRVALIVNAERLSAEAENCLLKTLEEPPPHALIVLTAEEADVLLPTTVSRCRQIRLKPVPAETIADYLRTELGVDDGRATLLAALADGRPGWAISAANRPEHLAGYEAGLQRLLLAIDAGKLSRLEISRGLAERWSTRPDSVRSELRIWARWWRDLLLVRLGLTAHLAHVDRVQELRRLAAGFSMSELRMGLATLAQVQADLDQNVNARLALDAALLRLPGRAA